MRWLRLLRLAIACLALALGNPASAHAAIVDPIVMVAEEEHLEPREHQEHRRVPRAPALLGAAAPDAHARIVSKTPAPERAPFLSRLYLRHCVLLR